MLTKRIGDINKTHRWPIKHVIHNLVISGTITAQQRSPGLCRWHQVYLSFRPIPSTNQTASVAAIENCVAELRSWMISNMLMVNDSKTEFLIVGNKQQLENVNIPFIHVGEDQLTPVTSVRNLGVIFDSNLKMDMQITKACQNANYHLHNIRRIRKFLNQEATCTVIHAFITSQIDYCNSLMNGLPENLIEKL